jgi:SAM-dependent methyltransferase
MASIYHPGGNRCEFVWKRLLLHLPGGNTMMTFNRIKRILKIAAARRFDYFAYTIWVRLKRLDFSPVPLEKPDPSWSRAFYHSASGGVFLSDVLKKIEIPRGSRVLDLGSGKGSATCTLAKFSFEEVVGVELFDSLVRIAEINVRRIGLKNVALDAGHFKDLDRFTHIFMFNPFPCSVMDEVMRNLAVSLIRKPRRVTLIYLHPVCHHVVMSSGLFAMDMEIILPSCLPFYIYTHDVGRT